MLNGREFVLSSIAKTSFQKECCLLVSNESPYGPVHKRHPHKIAKIWPSPLCPQNTKCLHWLNPLPPNLHSPVRADIPYILKGSQFLHQKFRCPHLKEPSPLVWKMSAQDNPLLPPTADVFYGQPLR